MTKPKKPKPAPTITIRKDGTVSISYGPARGYSWKPFEKDNMAAVTHGAYSDRIIAAKAFLILEELWPFCGDAITPEDAEVRNELRAQAAAVREEIRCQVPWLFGEDGEEESVRRQKWDTQYEGKS